MAWSKKLKFCAICIKFSILFKNMRNYCSENHLPKMRSRKLKRGVKIYSNSKTFVRFEPYLVDLVYCKNIDPKIKYKKWVCTWMCERGSKYSNSKPFVLSKWNFLVLLYLEYWKNINTKINIAICVGTWGRKRGNLFKF